MNISRQIGWSNESNLLYQILKQLTKLTGVIFNLTPKYKVYTALLSQSGGDNPNVLSAGDLMIGRTYEIKTGSTGPFDFTNVGAPNNNIGTFFVATGTTPNNWASASLNWNEGAPVVTVLENNIGNVWFTYNAVGIYRCVSNDLFTIGKTAIFIRDTVNTKFPTSLSPLQLRVLCSTDTNKQPTTLEIYTGDVAGNLLDDVINSNLDNQFAVTLEIRVYN